MFGWISPTRINISYRYSTHTLTTILLWILCSFVRIKLKMADLSPFLFAQIDKIFLKFVHPDEYLPNTNDYFFPILYTCIYYIFARIMWRFFRIKFKMADLSLFLFAQIDKIFENFVRLDKYFPTPINIGFCYFTHALTTIFP